MRHTARQKGMTLFMSLIMLVLLTLVALSSFKMTQSNMQVVTNMQQRDAATYAVRGVLAEVVSSDKFSTDPGSALAPQTGCGNANMRCIDTNGDQVDDVTVKLTKTPTCVKVKTIKTSDLDLDSPKERDCLAGAGGLTGVFGANTGDSFCSDTVWEVQAEATDKLSEAKMTVTQGVSIRAKVDDVKTLCPG